MGEHSTDLSRRRLVRVASLATGALAFTDISSLFASEQDAVRRETADLITGPFYPRVKPRDRDADLTLVRGHHRRAAGQVVQLSGRVTNAKGEPLRNAQIEIWQATCERRISTSRSRGKSTARSHNSSFPMSH
jgi:protocatechuate 3,4-dioxygenase beta subunit